MIEQVLDFWFAPGRSESWFVKDPAFDQAVRDTLASHYERAVAGACDGWEESARGALALSVRPETL